MIENLMLIDDESVDQKLYRRVVESSGLVNTLHQFMDAESALAFLAEDGRPQIDAILLDINMPRMSGFDFLEAATAEFGDNFTKVAVIMLTTSARPEDEARARQFPVVKDYINKPLAREHLEKIAELLAQ